MEHFTGILTLPANMRGLPLLVNEGAPLFASLAGYILIFAALVCLGQLLYSYLLIRKSATDEPLNPSIVTTMEYIGLAMVFFGSITLVWVVPEPPYQHLYNPGHWGLIGYGTTVLIMVCMRLNSPNINRWEPYLFSVFLGAMPFVYLGSWIVFGGSYEWLSLELLGVVFFVGLAFFGFRKALLFLAVGTMLHGVWDISHWQNTPFVPDWYIYGCALVDFTAGGYVLSRFLRSKAVPNSYEETAGLGLQTVNEDGT